MNPDKSEALIVGTSSQLNTTSIPSSVSVAGTDLPVADSMKVLNLLNHFWKSYTSYQFANALTTSWPY